MKLLLLTLIPLAGCVSVSEKIAMAPTLSSYSLCEKLATATLADSSVREAWAMELQRRGENCSQFGGTIAARQAADAQLMQLSNQLQQQHRATPAPAVGFLKSSYISGLNRICIYDRLGSQVVTTIPAASICPLNQ